MGFVEVWMLLWVTMAGDWLAYGELGLAAVGFAPFALHRWSCSKWLSQQLQCPEEMSGLDMTILLPVWNEGLIIEKKLANLAKQDFKCHLLIIEVLKGSPNFLMKLRVCIILRQMDAVF